MITKNFAAALLLLLSATSAAMAQSAYTTGTIASDEAAGYPSPYGTGSGYYAYFPGYDYGHHARVHRHYRHPARGHRPQSRFLR
jgi:hypothetical protein